LEGALNDGSVEELAARMGLGSRHLRRLFVQHLGASPLKIATTHRVHLARKLIDESPISMTRIAFYSGFRSIREFNHAVLMATWQSPSELRRAEGESGLLAPAPGLELRLPYRKPFDWENLLAFLRNRAIPGVEAITDTRYRRTIEVGGVPGLLEVSEEEAESRLLIRLQLDHYEGLAQTVERIRRLFDLCADPVQIASHLSRDPKLGPRLGLRPGLRVPGAWDGFEAAVLAVLGQQLSRRTAAKAAVRLVRLFGTPVATRVVGLNTLFPRPDVIVAADLSKAGIDDARAATLRRLARSVVNKRLPFSAPSLEQAVAQIRSACGVDESTANYIAMRAFGEPDAFPGGEARLLRRLAGSTPDRWRPWRAYAAMHLTISMGSGVE
jgi:AraC family transcriptional regulator of adaptative response / DNA-3-methyladenine glycosylase II